MSQYLLLIWDRQDAWDAATAEARAQIHKGHTAFGEKHADAIVGGNALQDPSTATSLRLDGAGFAVTDGPFVETKEGLGGYYLIEAADLDQAVAIARDIPVLAGGVEVRPVMVMS